MKRCSKALLKTACYIEDLTIIRLGTIAITCYAVASVLVFNKKNPYSIYGRYKLYTRGVKKFEEELDIEYYTKSLRNLKTMVSAMMDESERFMSVYQQCNSISVIGSLSDTDSDNEITKGMPKYMENKNKVSPYSKHINMFLAKYYAENLTSKDYRLLKGTYTSKKLKNYELEKLASKPEFLLKDIDEDSHNHKLKLDSARSDSLNKNNNDDITGCNYENAPIETERFSSHHLA